MLKIPLGPGQFVLSLALLSSASLISAQPAQPSNDCMRFVADVTIPDGTQVRPGATIEKTWRLLNCGQTTWDGYHALRSDGRLGPEVLDVPVTPPGATADVTTAIQVPDTIGQYHALYRLMGRDSSLGGFTVVVDAAECSPTPAVEAESGSPLTAQVLLPSNSDLPGQWCLVGSDGDTTWSSKKLNSAEYSSPRRAQFWASLWPSSEYAEQALRGLPKDVLFTEAGGIQKLDSGAWNSGDAVGKRQVWSDSVTGFAGADYLIRLDNVLLWTRVSGGVDQRTDLDQQARAFAETQVERVRENQASAPVPSAVASATPDEVYTAVLESPIRPEELPGSLTNVDLRALHPSFEPSQPQPVGVVEVLASGPRHDGDGVYRQLYVVYPSVVDAEDAFDAFSGIAYAYVPRRPAFPTRCTSVGLMQNGCAVLVGNVLVYGVAEGIDLGPGMSNLVPGGPGADELAAAGVTHLQSVLGGLPWTTAAPRPRATPSPTAPVAIPAFTPTPGSSSGPSPAAATGAQLLAQKECVACHTIPGVPGATRFAGPDLAGIGSRTKIASGTVSINGPKDLERWLLNPSDVKPGTIMPNLGLSNDETTRIVAYLETLK
jgi:cytochrome c2